MKFWCEECNKITEADSFEINDNGEATPYNGVGEHTHCDNCQNHLSVRDCRDLEYIKSRLDLNKVELDKYGAKEYVPGNEIVAVPIEKLTSAQALQKDLIHAQSESFRLIHEGVI